MLKYSFLGLICTCYIVFECYGQLLRPDIVDLGIYNPASKKYERTKPTSAQHILGGDEHDYKWHKMPLLGSDDHDLKIHKKTLLGAGDHDYKSHKKVLLGAGDHDYRKHGKKTWLGGGDPDYRSHGPHWKLHLGADGHDYRKHGKKVRLGADGHDYRKHGKKVLLGGDDHDHKTHSRKALLGADDHDFQEHVKKALLGADDHDFKKHGKKKLLGGDSHDHKKHKAHKNKSSKKKSLDSYPHIAKFRDFTAAFNKTYASEKELRKRFSIFRNNLKKIKLMRQNEMGTAEYGITKFADWSIFEYRKMLGLKPHLKPSLSQMKPAEIPDLDKTAPMEFDWRDKGVVTPVKNQGMCGSCWAFSVTGNIEGQWAIKHNKLYSLSEQELVDCDDTDKGCEGGLPENAYKSIQDLGGLETENGYPYEGIDDKCQLDSTKIKVKVNGSVELPEDEEKMKAWLLKNGPISIGINANALQFYMGGVSHPYKFLCNPDNLDHGMLIVGFGVHTTKYLHRVQPYWLVKNSWGSNWGEKGYYRVYRGDGTCGVNKMATSGMVV